MHLRAQEEITLTGCNIGLLLEFKLFHFFCTPSFLMIIVWTFFFILFYTDQIPIGRDPYIAITFDEVNILFPSLLNQNALSLCCLMVDSWSCHI